MMGDIYWYAERVLACVGPHENDSEFLTREIERRHGVLVHASRLGFTGAQAGEVANICVDVAPSNPHTE